MRSILDVAISIADRVDGKIDGNDLLSFREYSSARCNRCDRLQTDKRRIRSTPVFLYLPLTLYPSFLVKGYRIGPARLARFAWQLRTDFVLAEVIR